MDCRIFPGCNIDPPCALQLAPMSRTLPDHICHSIARSTVEDFARQRILLPPEVPRWHTLYLSEYPLPIGAKSLAEWLGQLWTGSTILPSPGLDRYGTQASVSLTRTYLEEPDGAPQPLVSVDDAWLGLAVCRTFERPLPWSGLDPEQQLVRVKEMLLNPKLTDAEMKRLGRRLLRGPLAGPHIGTIWLLGLVEPVDRATRTFRFTTPIVQTESLAQTSGERDMLHKEEHRLWTWYHSRILGTTLHEPERSGRPPLLTPEDKKLVLYAIVRRANTTTVVEML